MKGNWTYEKIELHWDPNPHGEDREGTGYVWSKEPTRLLATVVAWRGNCRINTMSLGGLTAVQRQILELYLKDEQRKGLCICIKKFKEE